MTWRLSNGRIPCTAVSCGARHLIAEGEPYVHVQTGSNRCLAWVTPQRVGVEAQIRDVQTAIAATGDVALRGELESRLADLRRQHLVLFPPADLHAPEVPVPAPTLFGSQIPRSQGFVRVARRLTPEQAAQLMAFDAKRRQAGDQE